jgi:DNA helicase-2/ATP-dependent DNA helicase PcrA
VLSDTHLAGIATNAPTSLDELARCPGIGPTKLERYGDEIIAVIADTG